MIPHAQILRRHKLRDAVLALSSVITVGVVGLMWIEGWSVWKAFYFTLITVTTVGYGDEGISETGRKFATFLLVGGIGASSYTFALMVQHMAESGSAWVRRMQGKIDKLQGHTIVCGFGRMGKSVCRQLAQARVPLVVIDRETEAVHEALELGYMAIQGSAGDDDVVERAGVGRAGHLVTVLGESSENIVTTLTARGLRPDIEIIARPEREEETRKLVRAGASRIVSPFQSGGAEIALAIKNPKVADFLARASRTESGLALDEILIAESSSLVGRTIAEYGAAEANHVSFVALEREDAAPMIPPRGEEALRGRDLIIVAGDPEQVARMRERAGDGDGVAAPLPGVPSSLSSPARRR